MWEVFSDLRPENLTEFLEVKLMKLWGPLKVTSPGTYVHSSPISWLLIEFLYWWFLLPVSCDSLYFPVSTVLGAVVCYIDSLMNLRRGLIFSLFRFFLVEGKSDNFQILYTSDQKAYSFKTRSQMEKQTNTPQHYSLSYNYYIICTWKFLPNNNKCK